MFSLSDYTYHLPESLIAQEPIHPHHDARMMVINRETGELSAETTFWNLDTYLGDDRIIFFNDSRVIKSRIYLKNIPYKTLKQTKGILITGEIFYLSSISNTTFDALVRPGNKFKIGTIFEIGNYNIEVLEITESGRILKIHNGTIDTFLEDYGTMPLPPYIEYTKEKESDYQTVFAKTNGSVAAPTASLHFTKELLEKIQSPKEYLTLHVGLGTFKGIQTSDIRDYTIHQEKVEISIDMFTKIADIKNNNKKIVGVGTTAMRTLESLPYLWKNLSIENKNIINAKTCNYWNILTENIEHQNWIHNILFSGDHQTIYFDTSIYITPGYEFLVINDLITNFHLGESSLLVLVSAFLGNSETRSIYHHAIEKRYRFYSFGDGMYIRGK